MIGEARTAGVVWCCFVIVVSEQNNNTNSQHVHLIKQKYFFMMADSFNEQTTDVVVWNAPDNPYDVQSPLRKMVTPAHKSSYTLSTVKMSSSYSIIGCFVHTKPTAIFSTILVVGSRCW